MNKDIYFKKGVLDEVNKFANLLKYNKKKFVFGTIGILVLILFAYILKVPPKLEYYALSVGSNGRTAMKILGITLFAIFWWVGEVLPDWTTGLLMLIMWIIIADVPFSDSFSAFNSTSIWLVIGAFCISTGISKTGLFKRISHLLIKVFSPSYEGQIFGLLIVGTICAPLIPSVTAKALLGASIANNISESAGFEPNSKGKNGIFIASWFGFALTAPVFMTGGIMGYTLLGMLPEHTKLDWISWFIAMLPWLLIFLVLSYILIRVIYNPFGKIKGSKSSKFNMNIETMGKMSVKEIVAALILMFVVTLWILESKLNINSATTALIGAVLIFAFKILEPREISTAIPWSLVIFLGAVLNLGNIFSKVGLDLWLQNIISPIFNGINSRFVIVVVIFISVLLIRIVLSSQTATIIILMPILTPVIDTLGISPFIVGMIVITTGVCWFLPYQNIFYNPAVESMNGTVSYNDTVKASFMYETINLLACLLSIPYWTYLGYM